VHQVAIDSQDFSKLQNELTGKHV
ncbi:competence protein ComE, partial [Enterococcus faecium]